MNKLLRIRDSLATTLLKVVFGIYLVVTIVITVLQMVSEFHYTGNIIKDEMIELSKSFSPGIAGALWTYNTSNLDSILSGMLVNSTVVGVKVNDGTQTYSIGKIENHSGKYIEFDQTQPKKGIAQPFLNNLIQHEFPIFLSQNPKQKKQIGTGTIYSSTAVVFERVKYGFYLIFLGAIVKTLILWFLFIYFVRQIVGNPLNILTQKIHQIDLDNLEQVNISTGSKKENELKLLEQAFNQMLKKLKSERQKLNKLNHGLEQKINNRTLALKNEIEIRIDAQTKAEIANQAKTAFLNNMSHELRTPMNGIIGYAFLLGESHLEKEQKEAVESIKNSAENLLKLINDIFDFSKANAGTMELKKSPFNLKMSIQHVIDSYLIPAKQKSIAINLNLSPTVPEIYLGDQARIEQILDNLLNNALKFTEHGHININVVIRKSSDEILIAVQDTGIGITEEQLISIFESFTQVDDSTTRKFGGTGIGLSICKHLIDLMEGRIWVESTPSQGSLFSFSIPLPSQQDLSISPEIDNPILQRKKQFTPLVPFNSQILMLETIPEIRIFSRNYIVKLGFEVDMVESSAQAVRAMERKQYAIIFIRANILKTDSQTISTYMDKNYSTELRPKIIVLKQHEKNLQNNLFEGENPNQLTRITQENLKNTFNKYLALNQGI